MPSAEDERLARWRLILGAEARTNDGKSLVEEMSPRDREMDRLLGFLFDREHADNVDVFRRASDSPTDGRDGGAAASRLTIPDWLSRIREFFPRSTADRLTRVALERYKLTELLADKRLLESAEPNVELLRAILSVKSILPDKVLQTARRIVRRVVDELREKFSPRVRAVFAGSLDRHQASATPLAKNFDAWKTVRRNLKHYSLEQRQLVIERAHFFARRERRHPWDLIMLVDQSGSMVDSVIHSAVMASIFRGVGGLRTKLVAFDTSIVDLSEECDDPLEVLMSVQLGGGTDIALALRYAETLVSNPRRTIVVLVSDLFEGNEPMALLRAAVKLMEAGVTLFVLTALDQRAEPAHDEQMARKLVDLGAEAAALTPDRLAEWVARVTRT